MSGLKNRAHTLTLCRLMVRAEDLQSRAQLLKLLQGGEPACRRLFLDYHGLRLIWSWMMDVGSNKSNDGLCLRMEVWCLEFSVCYVQNIFKFESAFCVYVCVFVTGAEI